MATDDRRSLLRNLVGWVVDMDVAVRETTGKGIAGHVEDWWKERGRTLFQEAVEERAGGASNPLARDYALLGLTPKCSDELLQYAYHTLMKRHHPDKGGDEELAKKVNIAYERICKSRGIQ